MAERHSRSGVSSPASPRDHVGSKTVFSSMYGKNPRQRLFVGNEVALEAARHAGRQRGGDRKFDGPRLAERGTAIRQACQQLGYVPLPSTGWHGTGRPASFASPVKCVPMSPK